MPCNIYGMPSKSTELTREEPPRWLALCAVNLAALDELTAARERKTFLDAQNADLRPFAKSGGKLLMYHGWSDPQIPAGSSVGYYTRVMDAMGGPARTQESVRLYMVPGMNHCQGGPGTGTFDEVAAAEQWLQTGRSPAQIPASRATAGRMERPPSWSPAERLHTATSGHLLAVPPPRRPDSPRALIRSP